MLMIKSTQVDFFVAIVKKCVMWYDKSRKEKINMSDELKTKIDWSCRFAKHKYEIYEGCLRIVEHTNLAYVEPHKVIINNRLYLFFNEQKYFYLGNLQNKIPLAELSEYIARH